MPVSLGGYEIQGALGKGGAGADYRAWGQRGEVAIKALHRLEHETLARFEREARIQEQLGADAGFVPLIEVGRAPSGPYLVMPLLRGGTLRDRLRGGALGVEETVALGRRLAKALGRAHELGVVHRDLKPENVLFGDDGAPL